MNNLISVTCHTFAVLVVLSVLRPVSCFGQTPSNVTPQGVPLIPAAAIYPNPNPGVIPETAPINRDQAQWTKDRNQCQQYFARSQMSPSQLAGLPPISQAASSALLFNCRSMIAPPVPIAPAPAGTPVPLGATLPLPPPPGFVRLSSSPM